MANSKNIIIPTGNQTMTVQKTAKSGFDNKGPTCFVVSSTRQLTNSPGFSDSDVKNVVDGEGSLVVFLEFCFWAVAYNALLLSLELIMSFYSLF